MENLASLLRAKSGTSEDMQDIVVPNNMNTNMSSVNFANNMSNFGCINENGNLTTSSQCRKCQEIYTLLSAHILECHKNELSSNEKDNGMLLNNILTSILMILTNKTDIQTRSDSSFDPSLQGTSLTNVTSSFTLAASSSDLVTKSVQEPAVSQNLNPLISQDASLALQKHLKTVQTNSASNLEQVKSEEQRRKTVLQGIPLLDQAMQAPGSIPLVLTNQLQPDGTRRPAVVPVSCIAKTSEKSDLDVADILVNKMPFPSVNKEESSLAQLYLKQLAEGLAAGNSDLLRHTDTGNQSSPSDRELLAALLNINNGSGCTIASAPTVDTSNKPVVETISQIVAAQKQLTNLLSLLGRKPVDPPLLPVAGLASQLVESPLNNPLFANQQRIAAPSVLQIPLSSLLPASVLAQTSQGIIPSNLAHATGNDNTENTAATFSNIFTRPPQPFQVCSAAGTITLPALALNSNLFQSSAVPVLQQTVKGSLQGSGQQTVLMPSGIQGSSINPQTKTLFSTLQNAQQFLPRSGTNTRSSQQPTGEQKSLYTSFSQSANQSLTEQPFQNSSSIPKLALTTMPPIFNLGSIPGISVLNAGLQSQAQSSSLPGDVSVRSIPLLPSSAVVISSGSQTHVSAVDKIQGLISAAIQNPRKSTSAANITTSKIQKNEGILPAKHRLPSFSLVREKMEGNQSTEVSEPAKLYECGTCGTTFSVLSTLQQHEQIHLGTKMQCNYCNDVFSDATLYQEHISLHRGEENVHHCEYCSKLFTSRGELQKHLAEHTQKRPYKCNHCSKSFRDPGSLQKHERIHTGERPYKCKDCPRAFAEYSSLRKHNRVHTGEKPYKCSHCPKAFSISGNLQRHLYIHTGERPYRCTKCPKAFNNPSHLRRHVKNLHEGKKGFSASPIKSDDDLEMNSLDNE